MTGETCVLCQKVIKVGQTYSTIKRVFPVHLTCLIASRKRKQ